MGANGHEYTRIKTEPQIYAGEAVDLVDARLRPVVETPDFASSLRLREATSGRPGDYVGPAGSGRGGRSGLGGRVVSRGFYLRQSAPVAP